MQDSYHIIYPDGMRLTWYRVMRLDQRWMWSVLAWRANWRWLKRMAVVIARNEIRGKADAAALESEMDGGGEVAGVCV